MMKVSVENPTSKSKAVRIPGDLHVIPPGKKASLDVDWSDNQRAKYERAGLVIKEAKKNKPAAVNRDDAIAEAIFGLKADQMTADGKPEVDAINAALPEGVEKITADERDAVWEKSAKK